MSDASTWIILNPTAGGGDPERHASLVAEATSRGWTVRETSEEQDASQIPSHACAAGAARIIVGGGDGTLHAALNALARCDDPPTLGVLPLGTANDFARGAGLPRDPMEALDVAAGRHIRPIDLVRVTGADGGERFLINAATGGLSVQIRDALDHDAKQRWGGMAYAKVVAQLLPDARSYRVTLRAEGYERTDDAVALIVLNGPRAGGQHLHPDADPGDGQLDVMLVAATDLSSRSALLARFTVGTHEDSPDVDVLRTDKLQVTAEPNMPFLGDGETLGSTPMTFEVLLGRLKLAIPRPNPQK